jgi:DNA helicase-2/ATP-dependent DNA helicase PcrA
MTADPVSAVTSPTAVREVAEEERLLQFVQATLAKQERRKREAPAYDAEMLRLRDALSEERLADDQASILEQMDRLAALSSTRAKFVEGAVDPMSPYFGHMRLVDEDGESKDILLGKQTFIRDGVRIVDWRNAPISKIFYRCREGDSYDAVIAGREVSGEVELRRTVTVVGGHLIRVGSPRGTWVRTLTGWQDTAESASLAGGAGTAARPDTAKPILGLTGHGALRTDKHLPEIAALLDSSQFELITAPSSGLVAIQGSAGSGKTTVGLHRLAYLTFREPGRFHPQRMMVMVWSEALARYISQVLPALGVAGVTVRTLSEWVDKAILNHFPGLSRVVSSSTPGSVSRFKSHRILLPMLEAAAKANPRAQPLELFDELFTDRGWMARGVAEHAPGAFSPSQLEEIHKWCAKQHACRFEGEYDLDAGESAFDAEDDVILLRLYQLLRGPIGHRSGQRMRYDHLMVDEVQDFSPLELRMLIDTVQDSSVTLAGDTAQSIVEGKEWSDWSSVLDAIGQGHTQISPLRISYRSTRQIMEVARAVLGPLAPDEPLRATRNGAPVELFRCGGLGEATAFLADALRDLMDREKNAGVAILTRFPHQADEAWEALRKADFDEVRRVRDHEFSFGPGIEVTDIAQTKGLEFDYVVLLNCDEDTFPETEACRHLLHVGMTRAAHQLWLFSWRKPSPLLPSTLTARLAG